MTLDEPDHYNRAMTDSQSNWHWSPEPKIWILAALLVPLLTGLGAWQVDRAWQKQAQAERWQQGSEVAEWPPESGAVGQPVILEGKYDPEIVWMLDNRTREGRRGYEVLHLFETASGPVVVNRGWVAGPGNRDQLPEVAVPEGNPVTVRARVSDWPEPMVLGEVDPVNADGWPRRVAKLTAERATGPDRRVHPFMVRLVNEAQPGALRTGWNSERMGAATHYGYAAQWFALALLLLTLTVATSFRKYEDE